MGLRPRLVDHVRRPLRGPVRRRRPLLPPVEADVVAAAEEDVEAAVAVEVLHHERAARMGQRGLGVELPGAREGIAGGPLVPADLGEHVLAAVAVDVAPGVPVAAAFRAQDEGRQRGLAIRALREPPDLEGLLLAVAGRVQLGHAVTVVVVEREHLHVPARLRQEARLPGQVHLPGLAALGRAVAGIAVPVDAVFTPAPGDDVGPAVLVDVVHVVAVLVDVVLRRVVGPVGARHEVRPREPVRAGHDVGTAVAVEIARRWRSRGGSRAGRASRSAGSSWRSARPGPLPPRAAPRGRKRRRGRGSAS